MVPPAALAATARRNEITAPAIAFPRAALAPVRLATVLPPCLTSAPLPVAPRVAPTETRPDGRKDSSNKTVFASGTFNAPVNVPKRARAGRNLQALTMVQTRAVFPSGPAPQAILPGRAIAVPGMGILSLENELPPDGSLRLPRGWRDSLRRLGPFAGESRLASADPRSCLMLAHGAAYAGSTVSAIEAPLPTEDGQAVAQPVLLPAEIAWHNVPGESDDYAWIWAGANGRYCLQTEGRVRVHAYRPSADIDPHPWARFFEGLPADASPYEIEHPSEWLAAFTAAPSPVIDLQTGVGQIHARAIRADSVWSCSSADLPARYIGQGEQRPQTYSLPAQYLRAAFRALAGLGPLTMWAGEKGDPIFFTADDVHSVAIAPVQVTYSEEFLPEEPVSERALDMYVTISAIGGVRKFSQRPR